MTWTAGGVGNLIIGSDNQPNTFSSAIENSPRIIALTKTGNGTLTLIGSNAYTGGTSSKQARFR